VGVVDPEKVMRSLLPYLGTVGIYQVFRTITKNMDHPWNHFEKPKAIFIT